MVTREATLKDCDSITEIHLRSFDNFFLSSLGRRFLKIFYKACIKNPESIAVVCCSPAGEIVGFAVGTSRSEGYYRKLLIKNIPAFFLEAALLLFTKPKALKRLALNLTKSDGTDDADNAAELLSIATLPEFKGSGIGKQLLDVFEVKLRERGCITVSLTTDYYDNADVVRFYQNGGYKIKNDFIAYPDRRMYRMIKHLN